MSLTQITLERLHERTLVKGPSILKPSRHGHSIPGFQRGRALQINAACYGALTLSATGLSNAVGKRKVTQSSF